MGRDTFDTSLEDILLQQQQELRSLPESHSPQIQKLAPKHHAIMDFILSNPQMKLQHVAAHFGVSQPWLSTIIHSECFQALLADKQRELFEVTALTLNDKITGLAHRAVERLVDKVEVVEDPKALKDIGELALKSLGYGTKTSIQAGDGSTIQIGQANSALIHQARERMLNRPSPQPSTTPGITFDAEPAQRVSGEDGGAPEGRERKERAEGPQENPPVSTPSEGEA